MLTLNGRHLGNHPEKTKVVYLDVKPSSSPPRPREDNFLKREKPQEDVFYENTKPVLSVLRMLGALPVSRPKPGFSKFSVASAPMAYSLLVLASVVSYTVYTSTSSRPVKITRSGESRFEEAVIGYLFTVYLFPVVAVPILWYEARKIVALFNKWSELEIDYRRVCGRPLDLRLRTKAIFIAIVIPTLSTCSVVITHATMVHFKIAQIVPYVFLEVLTYMLGGYWYLLCEALGTCATTLADDFQQALKHVGPAGMVAEYRALWLRLSKLARDTGVAHCYTFTFINLYLFLIITLSIYGLMSQISEGFGSKDIGLAVTATFSICLLFFICDVAHYASHNVRTNFQKKLLMVELSWMNSDAQTEVNMFLRATEMNTSAISLDGYFDVDRNLFKSLLATMVTYLVVLLQFQISIPEEANSGNGTHTN